MAWVKISFVFAAVLVCFAVVLGAIGLSHADMRHREPLFIASAGFVLASAGWVLNNAVSVMIKVRELSLNYMLKLTDRANEAADLNKLWVEHGLDELTKDPAKLADFFVNHSLDHPFFRALRVLANSYEEMSVAVLKGVVDEDMLLRSFGTNFRWFYWSRLKPFLPLYRNDPPLPGNPRGTERSPKTFSHCQELALLWRGNEK